MDLTKITKHDIFNLISKDWMLITAGDSTKFNTMTASWGGFGYIWNRPVAYIFIRESRYTHEFMDKGDKVTLSFFSEEYRDALKLCGSQSGRDTFEQFYVKSPGGLHTMYIVEIEDVI